MRARSSLKRGEASVRKGSVARSKSRSEKEPINKPRAIAMGAAALVCLAIAWPQLKLLVSDSAAENMTYMDASSIPWNATPAPASAEMQTFDAEQMAQMGLPGMMPVEDLTVPERDGPEMHVTDMLEDEKPPEPKIVIQASADGDLAIALRLRWSQFESGDRVLARVRFTNHSLRTVYRPAAGEPDPGFAVVVEDADGNEVRRVVEASKGDQLPRRMARIDSATEVEFPVTIVAEDETPLPPGKYTAYAELRADPKLGRLGLPTWTAPKGPIRSESVALTVTAKAEKAPEKSDK